MSTPERFALACACTRWDHAVCRSCWDRAEPDRVPHRVVGEAPEPCCVCGQLTDAGIDVRQAPRS